MHSYCVSGLSVQSEVVLPGLLANPQGQAAPDVTVRRHPVPASLESATLKGPTWDMAGDRFLLRIPGVARFLLHAGRDIAFEPEQGAPPEDATIFITGTVFGILLLQRERVVLHASAVRVGDKAVLFCGRSGAGKSTIAAALGRQGYPLLNDDVCAIGLDQAGAPIAYSDGRQLKLWAQAIKQLDLADRQGQAVRNQLEKFYVEPRDSFAEPLPLGAVYGLRETRPPFAEGIERPNVVDAALLIRRSAYRQRLVAAMERKAQYFQSAANIAAKAGIFTLTRRLDFAAMPEIIGRLEAHWSEIGLLGAVP